MSCQNENEFIEVDEEYLAQQIKTKLSCFEYCEYEDENNDEYVYEFKNMQKDENLLIIVDDEATIYYADSHCHYSFYKNEIDMLIDSVLKIFYNELKVVKLYSTRRWLGDFWLLPTDKVENAAFLEDEAFPEEFVRELRRLGGKATESFWNKETITYKIEPIK